MGISVSRDISRNNPNFIYSTRSVLKEGQEMWWNGYIIRVKLLARFMYVEFFRSGEQPEDMKTFIGKVLMYLEKGWDWN